MFASHLYHVKSLLGETDIHMSETLTSLQKTWDCCWLSIPFLQFPTLDGTFFEDLQCKIEKKLQAAVNYQSGRAFNLKNC